MSDTRWHPLLRLQTTTPLRRLQTTTPLPRLHQYHSSAS
jgi:hypothetical protein